MPPPPPLKPGRKRSSSARSVSVSEETDLMSVAAALRPQDSDAAFLLSDGSVPSEVCAVADLLDLPLSPRRDAACIDSLSDLTFCPDGPKRRPSSPADHIPTAAKLNSDPDSGAMDLLTDASSTTSTVSPDCIGGATTHCENAWPRDPDLVLDPSACELPDPCDVGMADACGVEEADRRALALPPSSIHECGTEVDRRHAADDERSSRAAETSVPTTPERAAAVVCHDEGQQRERSVLVAGTRPSVPCRYGCPLSGCPTRLSKRLARPTVLSSPLATRQQKASSLDGAESACRDRDKSPARCVTSRRPMPTSSMHPNAHQNCFPLTSSTTYSRTRLTPARTCQHGRRLPRGHAYRHDGSWHSNTYSQLRAFL